MNNALETMEMLLGMKDPYLGLKQGVLVTSMIVGAFVGVLLSFYLVKSTPRRRFLYLIDLIFILGSLIIQV
jgi:predicted MFS family arabinose efflux permease